MLNNVPILLAEDDKNDIYLMRRAFDSAGYLNHWRNGQEIPERSCQRIFKAADQILRAGREQEPQ